jgi:putative tryptophan/tyrosine transport system substrate-binding protein
MEEATGAPSSLADWGPKRLRASGRDGGKVMTQPPSPLTMLFSRHTKRREFITLLGGAAVAWPLAARAQQAAMPVIGFLGSTAPSAESQRTAAFVQRLRELGWTEGRTVTIEYRWAEGRTERFAEIAAEFVRLKVDVIIAGGTPTAVAAKRATAVIAIVFAMTGDPVGTGLVARLARPGGNATGLSTQTTDTVSKRIELLREVVPNLRRLAILANIDSPVVVLEMGEVRAAANTLGLDVVTLEVRQAEDIERTFEALKGRADGLYVCADPLVSANRTRINALARSPRDCRPCTICGSTLYREVSCHMGPTSRICFGALVTMSTRFCAGQIRPIFRSSSRPSSS